MLEECSSIPWTCPGVDAGLDQAWWKERVRKRKREVHLSKRIIKNIIGGEGD